VTIDAGAGPNGGFLVLLDSYARDWEVTVDGNPGTLYRANLLFRAVRLSPGRHSVGLRYRPRMLVLGAALSMLGLIATGVLTLRVRPERRPETTATR
jgi:uncharacterized membrane protein YfhO